MGAEATAKELPRLGLADALELTLLIARKDPRRHPRVAARWLLRYLEEDDEATIDELALAASCLGALTGNGYPEAAQALRDMTEKATRRRRGRGVA
jgi:NAD(P)H-dependent FMN reductase